MLDLPVSSLTEFVQAFTEVRGTLPPLWDGPVPQEYLL